MKEIKLNTEQSQWLYKIRSDTNFYNSLDVSDAVLINNILSDDGYLISSKDKLSIIRKLWIRYVKLNNNKDI